VPRRDLRRRYGNVRVMTAIKIPICAFLRLRAAVRVIVTESSASGFRVIRYDDSAPGRDGLFPRIGQ